MESSERGGGGGLSGDSKTESRLEAIGESRKSVFWCFDYSSLTVSTVIT